MSPETATCTSNTTAQMDMQLTLDAPDASTLEFTMFPKLPAELRLKIWGESMSDEPRIIEVLWSTDRGFYTHARTPAILHVCSESRTLARKKYTAMVIWNLKNYHSEVWRAWREEENYAPRINDEGPYKGSITPFGAWVDYKIDIIYLSFGYLELDVRHFLNIFRSFLQKLSRDKSARLQHLALDYLATLYSESHLQITKHGYISKIALVASDIGLMKYRDATVGNSTLPRQQPISIREVDLDPGAMPMIRRSMRTHDGTQSVPLIEVVDHKTIKEPKLRAGLEAWGMKTDTVKNLKISVIDIIRG